MPLPTPGTSRAAVPDLNAVMSWIYGEGQPASLAGTLLGGALAAGVSVGLGAFLQAHVGGGEPLMAVFPILLMTCLRLGPAAGWLCLGGGLLGGWYVYLGHPLSFFINGQEVRALVTAAVLGALIIGVCAHWRSLLRRHARAEEALTVSEAQFRASFENAAVGKVQTEPFSGRIIRVNTAFAAMLGYRPEDLVGRIGWELTLEADRDGDRAAYQLMLDGHHPAYVREKRYVRRDGEVIWARVSATVTRSPKTGEPILTAGVIEDIDERHKARMALVATKRDLEVLSAEQAATIAQRDLLLREVYHRVKNNLQIIDSLLVMQKRRLTDPEARAALAGLRSRVFALGLVHHQLMGSGDLKTFDAAPFLEELSGNLLLGAASKGIALRVDAMPLRVGLDFAIPLGLIVTELVTNSLKHAFPSGEGAIEVLLKRGGDDRVVLIVSDDGVAESDDAPDAASASLGATIVDGLVRQLGGTLTVRRGLGFHTEIDLPGPVP